MWYLGKNQPDQTRPDRTRPDQTRPDVTKPDQTRTGQLGITSMEWKLWIRELHLPIIDEFIVVKFHSSGSNFGPSNCVVLYRSQLFSTGTSLFFFFLVGVGGTGSWLGTMSVKVGLQGYRGLKQERHKSSLHLVTSLTSSHCLLLNLLHLTCH